MQGRTHFTIGMATALIATQPATIPGVLATIAAGGIGGKLPDIDLKHGDIKKEEVFDSIISILFIGAIIMTDYLVGNGICQYVIDNWGIRIWIGLTLLIVLSIFGVLSSHRSFTHSFIALIMFGIAMYLFCMPIVAPFIIGYASHIIIDLFNKKGMTLFYPIKKRLCLNMCDSHGKASGVLYWIGLAVSIVTGAVLFVTAFQKTGVVFENIAEITFFGFFKINVLQIYLIIINIVTFFGFQRSWEHADREILAEKDKGIRIQLEFETWVLDFLAIIGGGIGMMVAFLIHGCFPSGYNGNWWAICYASVLGWFTIYCYVVNPFSLTLHSINWLEFRHMIVLIYLIIINIVSAFLFWHHRNRHLNEYNSIHTLLWFIGALGGTIGAYPIVIAMHRDGSYNYAVFGFPLMLVSQVMLIGYLMMTRII